MGKTAAKRALLDVETARLLDANLNRAREGLRVIEDIARFIWNDKKIFQACRRLRHDLHVITKDSYRELVWSRDSNKDMGRTVPEGGRSSLTHVVAANIRRAEEATRVLEEFSKVFSPRAAKDLKAIRYQLYIIEKAVIKKL